MALLYKADPIRGEHWQALFAEHAPDIEWRAWPHIGNPADIEYLAAWSAPEDVANLLPNLKVLFALSAGVDQLDLSRLPPQLPVIRLLDPGITQGMCEYASWAVLSLHRDMLKYRQQQVARCWQAHLLQPAVNRRVGVMGLGAQAQQILATLAPMGFALSGWARSAHQVPGVTCYAGKEQLSAFLRQCDILLCVLPLTEQTQGILDRRLFSQLPRGAALINMGRGGHLVEADLLEALDTGHLSGAVLDVLQEEPAPATHPFWKHPQIILTPHIAAMTQPHSAFGVLLENIRRFERDEPMVGEIDRSLGY
ncbi:MULTISPECIES: 2-hydroxyacid dehydrogenase [unclassified Pseudomonas]|uniref:2-hydroxyacid dehydrogenase n=1 Tax=unclassified Pseudomonas TaxID=196821 RepID=UPI000C86B3F1|nr:MULTISPECIES: glyoxylate/hydroxypyruvate reductase A [unclassified Pseudomonas]PMV22750.1 glyoxylate/hydroxypyruvate reductase A [Pseudomonas sp. FW305-3-2-15-C-TSA2]PMV29413.1 glyoxylate/hydroxypyruvate reductase A [Pseudomonas sp. DP16D-L5]PMV39316.1 glyoxylate/hydroxypyruvate reductase A [Pseudomonas sp. FW305-3-2-15-A-LB2]PMV45626.1 glyoxylate/hydroxypyruvate reductase A [Pseudomonas sp. FW305-3-2-15-C-R2A1]PMV51931.1 glyoxylate/hydroxypyruvate reductase A [Pseudomonas sp. FW305-3-2-15-